jgi:hypothetical protein
MAPTPSLVFAPCGSSFRLLVLGILAIDLAIGLLVFRPAPAGTRFFMNDLLVGINGIGEHDADDVVAEEAVGDHAHVAADGYLVA